MPESLISTINAMKEGDAFRKLLLNPSSQFGRPSRQLLGARYLPKRLVPNNEYTEGQIKYRTVIAADGGRYSPAQKRGNDIVGSMKVALGNQDIASEFTSEDYDNYIEIDRLNALSTNDGNPGMIEKAGLARWFDNRIVQPLDEKIEKMRWEAIVDASVPLAGDNGYAETVTLPNPSGQRVQAGGDWSSDAYDPFADIFAMNAFMGAKGYSIGAWVTSTPVLYALLNNDKVKAQAAGYVSITGGTLINATGMLTPTMLNAYLSQFGLPPIITYDLQWRNQSTTGFFVKQTVFVGLALTARDADIDLGDNERLPLRDTIGYVGVGRPAGAPAPGPMYSVETFGNKPPRAEFEGWQTTFPVVTDPEAVCVITDVFNAA